MQARGVAPAIIFIDEIDAVGRIRGGAQGNDERDQTLNQMLSEMDGFGDGVGVIVMAATNRKDVLDPALIRPGRFDRIIQVGLPDLMGRVETFQASQHDTRWAYLTTTYNSCVVLHAAANARYCLQMFIKRDTPWHALLSRPRANQKLVKSAVFLLTASMHQSSGHLVSSRFTLPKRLIVLPKNTSSLPVQILLTRTLFHTHQSGRSYAHFT